MMLFAVLATTSAHAFCGTYVSSAGTEVYNSASEVVIARQGTRTTLTVANDVLGDPSSFAMVVPVPQVVAERDVHVIQPEDIELIRTYSMPRLVEYSCNDFAPTYSHPCPWMEQECPQVGWPWSLRGGTNDSGWGGEGEGEAAFDSTDSGGGGGSSVAVEAEYIVGEYELVVLSAEQSSDLLTWLVDEGYAVPESTGNMLQEYIDAGSYFLAARVYPEAGVGDGDMLSPLQFSYDSDVFGLPIRIGTASSVGEQDLIVYAFTELEDGAVGISNYPELSVEDECMWDGQGEFGTFYAEQFTEAYGQQSGAIWTTEYAWRNEPQAVKCDPCTGPPPETQQLTNIGFDDGGSSRFHMTRLHVRYTPEEATQDLVFYASRQSPQSQKRYIAYNEGLEDRFPLCREGWSDDPKTCSYEDPHSDTECLTYEQWEEQCDEDDGCGGCATGSGSTPWWLAVVGLVIPGLRRRA